MARRRRRHRHDVTAKQLRLAGGKIKILGVAPGNFFLNQEILLKKSP